MQSLLQSMSPEQRAELQDAIYGPAARRSARGGPRPAGGQPRSAAAGRPRPAAAVPGDGPLGLEQALDQLDQLQALDALEGQIDGTTGPSDLASIDREQVRDLLGPDAERDLNALDDLTRQLEEAGYVERRGQRLELTPRATRRIGQKVLDELFAKLRRDAVRRSPPRPGRPRRRARGGEQAARIRRPVPARPAGDVRERAAPRGERAVGARPGRPAPPAPGRLRGLPHRARHLGRYRAARRPEPLDAAARLLHGGQARRDRPRHAHPHPVPARPRWRSSASPTPRTRSGARRWPSSRTRSSSTARTCSTACTWPAGSSPAAGPPTAR